MEKFVLTQLSVAEIRQLLQQELKAIITDHLLLAAIQPEPDEIGSIALALEITGLAKQTVYGLVAQSKIPYMKRGKKLYFSRKELTEWIKQGKRKTLADIEAEADNYISSRKKRG